jgi:hypothetical protein
VMDIGEMKKKVKHTAFWEDNMKVTNISDNWFILID